MRHHVISVWFVGLSLGTMAFVDIAYSQSGFHAQSGNLPATIDQINPNCSEFENSTLTPGAEYIPGRNVAGKSVVPADVDPLRRRASPVVRFDLGLGNSRRNNYKRSGLKRGQLRAKNLSVGEVSIDTATGEVALDGQRLARRDSYSGCVIQGR